MRDQFAELEDVSREGFDGDYVLVDVTTGEGDAPGSATDMLYEIGSGAFLPGMDEALQGKGAGHIAEFTTTLPATIGEEAGAEVTARVLVKQVKTKRLPELTDEWVDEVSEFDDVEEMRYALREQMEQVRGMSLRADLESKLLEELRAETAVVLPDALVDAEMESMLHRFAHRLDQQGVGIEQYLAITGQTQEAFVEDLRNQADASLRTRILLEGVAATEGLEVGDDEVEETLGALAEAAGVPVAEYREAVEKGGQEEALAGDILRRKAIDRLLELVVAVDADGNEMTLPEPERGSADDGSDEDDEHGPEAAAEGEE
jgi:trigger factor